MVDIYFKCDWCKETVEHKHVEKGSWISSDAERTHKLNRVTLNGEDSQICEYCYKAIQNKIENLRTCSEQEDTAAVSRITERCEKPSEVTYVEYNDDRPEISQTRSTSKDYQDSGVIVTCRNNKILDE